MAAIADADGMFLWGAERRWLQAAWGRAARLRWIHSPSDGVDWFLFPELVESAVEVTNARGVYEDAIAEWVVGAMLAFATRILHQRDAQLRREWSPQETERLAGQRLLVVGPGPIGRAVGWRAEALGMEVDGGRAHRASRRPVRRRGLHRDMPKPRRGARRAPTSCWTPCRSRPATDGFFDAGAVRAMTPTARFINVGRGATVDEPALIDALARRRIAGAALDVFERSRSRPTARCGPCPTSWSRPTCAGASKGGNARPSAVFVDNAGRFARGEPLRNPVDKRAGTGCRY